MSREPAAATLERAAADPVDIVSVAARERAAADPSDIASVAVRE